MKKRTLLSLLLCLVVSLAGAAAFAESGAPAEPAPVVYKTDMGIHDLTYIYNKTPLPTEAGTTATLEYKVVTADNIFRLSGLVGTDTADSPYPYNAGNASLWEKNYNGAATDEEKNTKSSLLENGASYRIVFTAGETNFSFVIKKTVDGATTDVTDYTTNSVKNGVMKGGYYGLFFGITNGSGSVDGIVLREMRFYDGAGNDLGFASNQSSVKFVRADGEMPAYQDDSVYEITLKNGSGSETMFFSNKTAVKGYEGSRVCLEYTVAAAEHAYTQSGVIATSTPWAIYPFAAGAGGSGYIKNNEKSVLLEEGARYKLVFTYTADSFTMAGTKTVGTKVTNLTDGTFADETYTENHGDIKGYFGIWLSSGNVPGEGIKLTDAVFYDENGRDLGFRANEVNENNCIITDSFEEVYDDVTMADIQVTYTVEMKGSDPVFLSNDVPVATTPGTKIYLKWYVESSGKTSGKSGFLSSGSPETMYPYTGGQGTLLQGNSDCLSVEDCTYLAQVEYLENGFSVLVKQTDADNKTISLTKEFKEFYAEGVGEGVYPLGGHMGLYFWTPGSKIATYTMQIYDENGENLGVRFNEQAAGANCTVTEPSYALTYRIGDKDMTAEFDEKYATYTCGKGMTRFPSYVDDAAKTHVEGWYYDAALTKKCERIERNAKQEALTLYGKMVKNSYTVTFDANDGVGTMADQVFAWDESKALTQNAFTRRGYEFLGWSAEYDATAADYTDGQTVSELSETNGDYVTLYAIWKLQSYTVTYELNGGTNGDNPTTFTINDAIVLKDATKEGVEFLGWYTSADFREGTKVTELQGSADMTLYARFSEPAKGGCGGAADAAGPFVGLGVLALLAALGLAARKARR